MRHSTSCHSRGSSSRVSLLEFGYVLVVSDVGREHQAFFSLCVEALSTTWTRLDSTTPEPSFVHAVSRSCPWTHGLYLFLLCEIILLTRTDSPELLLFQPDLCCPSHWRVLRYDAYHNEAISRSGKGLILTRVIPYEILALPQSLYVVHFP